MPESAEPSHWRRNMYVCLFGSFTTILAMTLLLPFLPIYVEQLGVHSHAAIVQWSGIAFGITFLGAGTMAPIWGRVADIYGRKVLLVRASLAMAVTMSLIGLAQNIWQLVALRLMAGVLGGYSSGAVVLVATQTPRHRAAWALGTPSTGVMAGTLLGPLVGGILPGFIGVRATFFLAGAVIFVAFLATVFLLHEERPPGPRHGRRAGPVWSAIPDRRPIYAMLATALLLMVANMSIEPILTVYVAQLMNGGDPGGDVVLVSGVVMAASAVGSMIAAPRLGRLADRLGTWNLITACLLTTGAVVLPQAFVGSAWQLIALRFLMGISLAGLLPSINATIRHNVPETVAGSILGYSTSAQMMGQVIGPLAGGFVGGRVGMSAVFLATSAILFCGAGYNWVVSRRVEHAAIVGAASE